MILKILVLGACLLLCSGCIAEKNPDLAKRFQQELYKEEDNNFTKEMIGVNFIFHKEGKFSISNKGVYDWKEKIVEVDNCRYDVVNKTAIDDTKCLIRDIDKVRQIIEAFDGECQKLKTDESELEKQFV